MRPLTYTLLLPIVLFTCGAFGYKVPDTAWQEGTLKDIQIEQASSISGNLYQGSGNLRGGSYTVEHFLIETPEMIYEAVPFNATTSIALRKGRLDFTVNTRVKFAVEKSEMYLRDSNGKEGKFRILKKTLKQASSKVVPSPAH